MKTETCKVKTYCRDCFSENRESLEETYGCNFTLDSYRFAEFMKVHSLENKECVMVDGEYFCKHHASVYESIDAVVERRKPRIHELTERMQIDDNH